VSSPFEFKPHFRAAVTLCALLAIGSLSACFQSGGSSSGGDGEPAAATYAKSFGGPGDDVLYDVYINDNDEVFLTGAMTTAVPGGIETTPWVAKLDELGNAMWETTTTTPTGVANLAVQFATATSDGGYVFAGEVEGEQSDRDVVLLKLSAAERTEWSLGLDGGPLDDSNALAGRGSADSLMTVLGDSDAGWYVVAQSTAEIQLPPKPDGIRTFINAPSVVVWFVSPDGTVVWQRRILQDNEPSLMVRNPDGSPPDFDRRGPKFLAAALSGANNDLILLLQNYNLVTPADGLSAGQSIVRVTAGGGSVEPVYTSYIPGVDGGSLTAGNDAGAAQSNGGLIALLRNREIDSSWGIIENTHRATTTSRLVYVAADGTGQWTWDSPEDVELTAVGKSGSNGVQYLWAGGASGDVYIGSNEAIRLSRQEIWSNRSPAEFHVTFSPGALWLARFSEGGSLLETCALAGRQVFAMHSANDTVMVLFESDDGSLESATFRDSCTPETRYRVPSIPEGYFSDNRVALEYLYSHINSVLPRWTHRNGEWLWLDDDRFGRSLRTENAGSVSVPASARVKPSSVVLNEFNQVVVQYMSRMAVLDQNGRMLDHQRLDLDHPQLEPTSSGPFYRGTDSVKDDAGRIWSQGGFRFYVVERDDGGEQLEGFENHVNVAWLDDDGQFVGYDLRNFSAGAGVLLDGRFTFQQWPASETGISQLVSVEDDLAATTRSAAVGNLRLADADSGRLAFAAVTDEGDSQLAYFDTVRGEQWALNFSKVAPGIASEVSLHEVVVAHDGGLVALLGITDPDETVGDSVVNDMNIGLLKIDNRGRLQWLRIYGGAALDSPANIRRTTSGYLATALSASVDAVTPGTRDIWLLKTGPDGHIQGLETGEDLCAACLRSISGGALLESLSVELLPVAALGEPVPYALNEARSGRVGSEPLALAGQALLSTNTARQCSGEESNFQEAAIEQPGESTFTLAVSVLTDDMPTSGSVDAGGRITSSPLGIDCGVQSACSATFAEGSLVELTASPYDGYEFVAWDAFCADGDSATVSVTIDQTYECQASFRALEESQTLTIAVIGNGSVVSRDSTDIDCREDSGNCSAVFPFATSLTLDAVADAGESFLQWGGDCAAWGTLLSNSLVMDSTYSCTATFSEPAPPPPAETVTVSVAVELDGQAVTSPGAAGRILGTGIDCSAAGQDCEETVVVGSPFTLQIEQVAASVRFNRWISADGGSICDDNGSPRLEFPANASTNCIAQFVSVTGPQANLRVLVITDGLNSGLGGRISSNPAGIEQCGSAGFECNTEYNGGTSVTLTAKPQPGYVFTQWSGDSATPGCTGTDPQVTVSMNGPRQCTALFQADTTSGTANMLTLAVDLPVSERPRVRDVDTGLVDCVGACAISLPIDQSPYRLRQTTPPGSVQDWQGCDALLSDPDNTGGPPLCEVDISAGARVIGLVPPTGS